jgi:hypothetical protein
MEMSAPDAMVLFRALQQAICRRRTPSAPAWRKEMAG